MTERQLKVAVLMARQSDRQVPTLPTVFRLTVRASRGIRLKQYIVWLFHI